MITTVTLNAAIDKTYYLTSFSLDKVNRLNEMHAEPGGKGNNVAKVLKTLNIPVTASGFVGGFNGNWITQKLDLLEINHSFVETYGESRICLNIIDERTGSQTEILENGPEIDDRSWEKMKKKMDELAKQSKLIIFSGSLAKGLPNDSYAQLIQIVQSNGAKAILDSSGAPLKEALNATPFMIKPNRQELEDLMGEKLLDEHQILNALREMHQKGIPLIVASLGEAGMLACYKGTYYRVSPPSIKAINAVGCGDSLVAGITAGIYQGIGIEESLIVGIAAASANALEKRAGIINGNLLDELKQQVKIEQIFNERR
jgi:tagatose 6-phosphate kinase